MKNRWRMAGTIAADLGFRVTQTGELLRNPPKSSFQGMSPASFRRCTGPNAQGLRTDTYAAGGERPLHRPLDTAATPRQAAGSAERHDDADAVGPRRPE